ncbi:hypothetical protein PG997_013565 [Apiospora hydei]|uniref:Uncharacterized protein n=1 Tax=Apiospora hydei TaxID=1337664 RepID=A0ABR1V6L2_9PEZI
MKTVPIALLLVGFAAATTQTPKIGDAYESLLPSGWPWTGTNCPPTFPCGMYPVSVTSAADDDDTAPTPTVLAIITTAPGLAAAEETIVAAAVVRERVEGGSWKDTTLATVIMAVTTPHMLGWGLREGCAGTCGRNGWWMEGYAV